MAEKNEQLRQARLARKITQEELAFLLNISPTTYARWELGQHEPSLHDLRALCTYFDCPPEQIGYVIYVPRPVEAPCEAS